MKSLFVFIIFLAFPLLGQDHNEELESSVKELSDYHEVIYPMWHTAYPAKDYAMLREMVPAVNSGAEKIYEAELPGILRDKQKKWDESLARFKQAVEDYNTAAEGDNNEALLTAAEVLHTNYELMVRVIRPVLPEMDDFHKTLYVVYHKYYPDKNYTRIKELTDEIISKAGKVKEAKLPTRLQNKSESYEKAAGSLFHSTLALKEALYSNNPVLIDNAVEKMHTEYQQLESIFN
jgi:hypothetical protein